MSLQHGRVLQTTEVTGPAGTIVRKKVPFCTLSLPGKPQLDPTNQGHKTWKKTGHIPLRYAPKPMVQACLQGSAEYSRKACGPAEPNLWTAPGMTLLFGTGEQRGGQNHTLWHTGNHAAEHD